eukprot:CAMPEP_0174245114 /NCGR_PEP_ID=MMETSP0417-20130205/37725_1 /TAXON_ID=242541 /ORGANISM="Mayorella sp, Strain BSH-02190019" /LENGTH=236 /DNA_ID=CAMNT_0015324867 /DNA_START=23 /DNA_END=733 /DNA_ORIENTATION=+
MIVVCLEGCHGSGKSRLSEQFRSAGYEVLDEGFLDMPSFSLHPQCLVMESIWVSNWIQRLLQKQKDMGKAASRTIFFADRSPYSAIFYAKQNGHLLHPLIKAQLAELKVLADVHIFTVYLKVDRELLWSRIQQRLKEEPHRRNYDEHRREWMETTVAFYERLSKTWDFEIHNNEITLEELGKALLSQLASRVSGFQHYCKDVSDAPRLSSGPALEIVVGSGCGAVSSSASPKSAAT